MLFFGGVPVDASIQKVGIRLASKCSCCNAGLEDLNHLFVSCSFSTRIWVELSRAFEVRLLPDQTDGSI